MRAKRGKLDPDWKQVVEGWKQKQAELRAKIVFSAAKEMPRFVAGVDCAFSRDEQFVLSAAVVYDRIDRQIVEVATAQRPIEFPYVPTFLSFREGPTVLEALGKLKHTYGAICFDGQGYAHPRRCGLATHLGVTLDFPAIGVAKSRLVGEFIEPGPSAGSESALMHEGEQIGIVLRTRDNVRPLFISVGHRFDLPSAKALVMACAMRRVPEPTRQADIHVGKMKAGV